MYGKQAITQGSMLASKLWVVSEPEYVTNAGKNVCQGARVRKELEACKMAAVHGLGHVAWSLQWAVQSVSVTLTVKGELVALLSIHNPQSRHRFQSKSPVWSVLPTGGSQQHGQGHGCGWPGDPEPRRGG